MNSARFLITTIAAAMLSVPMLPAQAQNENAIILAMVACAGWQARDHAIACQVEFPNSNPVVMLKFHDQQKAGLYAALAVSIFGHLVCDALEGADPHSDVKLALVHLDSGHANVYSCEDHSFGGWMPLKAAFR